MKVGIGKHELWIYLSVNWKILSKKQIVDSVGSVVKHPEWMVSNDVILDSSSEIS